MFSNNHAAIAGGIIYSTDLSSTNMSCGLDLQLAANDTNCHAWDNSNNTVGNIANLTSLATSHLVGYGGFGATSAFLPNAVSLSGASRMSINYISDGSSTLPIPRITVLDQAGNTITSGIKSFLHTRHFYAQGFMHMRRMVLSLASHKMQCLLPITTACLASGHKLATLATSSSHSP